MGILANLIVSSFLPLFHFSFGALSEASPQINGDNKTTLQTFIIQVRLPHNLKFYKPRQLQSYYESFLPQTGDATSKSRMMYQYSEAITGFAAKLTEAEVESIKKKPGFVNAYVDRIIPLLTTHTPTFLGLQGVNGFWNKDSTLGSGVIIGMLDTGVNPNHLSFTDLGMDQPPPRWNGSCPFKQPNRCNRKLIGGMDFVAREGEDTSTVDNVGHGTHTASTAAGNFVENAHALTCNGGNCNQVCNGTAAGMAPHAHLAAYKVCSRYGCSTSALLAGMDAAIKDGVDVMSLLLGGRFPDFSSDVISIATFSAMEKGIFLSCAAGNYGPDSGTLSNEAPWVLTVGASMIDRSIRVTVKLGNGQELHGESLYQPHDFTNEMIPLVIPGVVSADDETNCNVDAMEQMPVKGKIVLCHRTPNGYNHYNTVGLGMAVNNAGGAGMILFNAKEDGYTTLADAHVLPASHISYDDGMKILDYISEEHNPTVALIFEGTVLINDSAPSVASFSSRGPSKASPNILKPDIIGPGVNILAGWPFQRVSNAGPQISVYYMERQCQLHT